MAQITSLSQLSPQELYSYTDYLSWKFDQALELIKGKIFPMAGPSRTHQRISWKIGGLFFNHFKHHRCEAYAAPFDVRLFDKTKSKKADKDIYTVVQPDLCVICDLGKLDERGCLGAPDLIVEILSPGNSSREMKVKKNIYEEAGVLEYWIIDPNQENLVRYNLQEDGFYGRPLIFVSSEKVPSVVFPDLLLDLNELFPEKTEEDL